MSVFDAQTAQTLATRHKRSVPLIIDGLRTVNVLWARMIDGNKINWGGFGTHFDWYIRKSNESATWSSGQLGTRTFEEIDPIAQMSLPYCFVEKTYGVSEKSVMSNRAGGNDKIFDIQKENARAAQTALYQALAAACWTTGTDATKPIGLPAMCGDAYGSSATNASNTVVVDAGRTYGGKTLNTSAIGRVYSSNYATMGWDNWYLWPTLQVPYGIYTTAPTWNTDAVRFLSWMETAMTFSSDVSGTGGIVKPDLAIVANTPYNQLVSLLSTSQRTYNVPLGSKATYLADFPNIRVGSIDVVRDDNVPKDRFTTPADRCFVLDSSQLFLETYHTKSEGLIRSDFASDDPNVRGAVGVYMSWLGIGINTLKAVGCIVGLDD
jgi:hypothetical protein